MHNPKIGGLIKQSLIDFPGNISMVIFTVGCNMRCEYCHNPELVYPELSKELQVFDWENIVIWMKMHSKMLDAVVFTGGEPTLHCGLQEMIKTVKNLNIKVKLDTNGTNPQMLKQLINNKLLDFVAMDIKASILKNKYEKITGNISDIMLDNIFQSIKILNQNNVDYEFRTTLHESILISDIENILNYITGNYYLQKITNKENKLKNISINTDINTETIEKLSLIYKNVKIKFRE